MKIRSGFVSNSSSSSFIVKYRTTNSTSTGDTFQVLLTKEQLNLLKERGFRYTKTSNPYFVDTTMFPFEKTLRSFKSYDDIHLGYTVVCNQDDVIYFLLTNKIPFVALCHYDEELVMWDGKSEWFLEMPNIVENFSRNVGEQPPTIEDKMFIPKKIKVKDWIDKEKSFMTSSI